LEAEVRDGGVRVRERDREGIREVSDSALGSRVRVEAGVHAKLEARVRV
jgi:hypothetical protein